MFEHIIKKLYYINIIETKTKVNIEFFLYKNRSNINIYYIIKTTCCFSLKFSYKKTPQS